MTFRCQRVLLLAAALGALGALTPNAPAQSADADACRSLVPTAMGGPMLHDPNKIMLRWLATSNYELVYRGQVFLLDTYFDRGPRNRPTGVVPGDVKRADAIFIGHAHFDHISDVGPIAQNTKAKVVGAPITIETAYRLGVPQGQGTAVAGGEILKFKDVTVEAALAQHSTLSREVLDTLGKLYDLDAGAATPQQAEAEKAIREKGTFAPDVITKGTIAYGFTFATGFKLVWIDSAGPVTDGDRALAQKLAPVDVAIIAYQGHPVSQVQIPVTLELAKLFRPRIFMPAHHDQIFGTFVDLGVEPLFEAIQEAMPGTQTIAPLHGRPNCFDISKKSKVH
jgi:L-ascorbate metabolism protein UlaG (beta-lactamase superfamily)